MIRREASASGPADLVAAIHSNDEQVIDRATRELVNLTMFGRYWSAGNGILIERENGLWDIRPVARWDDAAEAERRNGEPWQGEWPTVHRR
ncbi:MAG: hypothetical protein WBA97_13635 [Actinophytocola sp.]|uniref:hypothetical protein n=1 Tax=Actinophytocola sp. TaxID=1872138 RepID=UPI003C7402AA